MMDWPLPGSLGPAVSLRCSARHRLRMTRIVSAEDGVWCDVWSEAKGDGGVRKGKYSVLVDDDAPAAGGINHHGLVSSTGAKRALRGGCGV